MKITRPIVQKLTTKKALKIVERFLKTSGPIMYVESLNEIDYGPNVTARRLTIRTYPSPTKTLTKAKK